MEERRGATQIRRVRRWGEGADEIDVHVGKRLREARRLAGMSQQDLASLMGVTFQQVQKYERGANRISASRLYTLSRTLGTTTEYFFEEVCADTLLSMAASDMGHAGRHEILLLVRGFQQIGDAEVRACLQRLIGSLSP